MKLIRFGAPGQEKPGLILADGRRVDVSGHVEDYNEAFFAADGLAKVAGLAGTLAASLPIVHPALRLGPPIARPSKIICVGLNYRDHAKESGAEIPQEPVLFLKASSALCGPDDPVLIPRGSKKLDYEVELAMVVGKRASYVPVEAAAGHVAGYCLHNDYSEREFQLERGGQWDKGKGCDSFAPLGPWLATPEELGDLKTLTLWLKVNGQDRQNATTGNMVFDPLFLLSYISQFMTLLPGDLISTGTPAGVGLGFNPPRYLQYGDFVELGIDGLGHSRQMVSRVAV